MLNLFPSCIVAKLLRRSCPIIVPTIRFNVFRQEIDFSRLAVPLVGTIKNIFNESVINGKPFWIAFCFVYSIFTINLLNIYDFFFYNFVHTCLINKFCVLKLEIIPTNLCGYLVVEKWLSHTVQFTSVPMPFLFNLLRHKKIIII